MAWGSSPAKTLLLRVERFVDLSPRGWCPQAPECLPPDGKNWDNRILQITPPSPSRIHRLSALFVDCTERKSNKADLKLFSVVSVDVGHVQHRLFQVYCL